MNACHVELTDNQDRVSIDSDLLQRLLSSACERMNRSMHVSVALVDDPTIADLHVRFLGIEGPTDVLSFPLSTDGEPEDGSGVAVEGEIVVSTDTAARTAAEVGIEPSVEVLLYALHGLLHLLGHDDHDPESFAKMHELERVLLVDLLGVDPKVIRDLTRSEGENR